MSIPSQSQGLWLRRLALAALLLAFCVVVFGAYVRLTVAGLGCPDWPGCYGHATPSGAEHSVTGAAAATLNVGKAWREMIHRYAAGTLVALIVVIAALSIIERRTSAAAGLPYALALVVIVLLQALLGALTVTWKVVPQIVTLHLLFGLTTLGVLWWLYLTLQSRVPRGTTTAIGARSAGNGSVGAWSHPNRLPHVLALIALIVLCVQIALGGWTSTNYAAIACPDFPTCQGSYWPTMDFRDAFVLWRPHTINYEGGVLTNTARVAVHFVHRLGALVTSIVLIIAAVWTLRDRALSRARFAALAVVVALVLQLTIGIGMVLKGFPLWLATAHNAGAAFAVLCVLALNHRLRYPH